MIEPVPRADEAIDHIAEAKSWISVAGTAGLSLAETETFAALAHAHASIALVEQQRVANIIAMTALKDEMRSPLYRIEFRDGKLPHYTRREDVEAALGL